MKFTILPLDLKLKRDFVVAGGRVAVKRNFLVVLDGIGLGEAAASVQYGATPEEIIRDLNMLGDLAVTSDVENVSDRLADMQTTVCVPALCAVSTAWHDLMGKRSGTLLHERLELPRPGGRATSVTVSIGDMDGWDRLLMGGYGCIKVKVGGDESWNETVVEKIGQDDKTRYRIDANAGWDYARASRVIASLPASRVELIEQPFPADRVDDWRRLRTESSIPVFMDESIASATDVKRVADYVDGVNIKIQKSGRLETAMAAIRAARESGLKVMLGCMIESSVGVAAAYQLSGWADFLDLDARLLIEDDPFAGLDYDANTITIHGEAGHGVSLA